MTTKEKVDLAIKRVYRERDDALIELDRRSHARKVAALVRAARYMMGHIDVRLAHRMDLITADERNVLRTALAALEEE